MMFLQFNTCSMVLYLTIQYQGEYGHIEGHAYSVYLSITNFCVFWARGFDNSHTTENVIIHDNFKIA